MGKVKEYLIENVELIETKTGLDFFEIQDVIFEYELDIDQLPVLAEMVDDNWTLDTIKDACLVLNIKG